MYHKSTLTYKNVIFVLGTTKKRPYQRQGRLNLFLFICSY